MSWYPFLSNFKDNISSKARGGEKEMGEVPRHIFSHMSSLYLQYKFAVTRYPSALCVKVGCWGYKWFQ